MHAHRMKHSSNSVIHESSQEKGHILKLRTERAHPSNQALIAIFFLAADDLHRCTLQIESVTNDYIACCLWRQCYIYQLQPDLHMTANVSFERGSKMDCETSSPTDETCKQMSSNAEYIR
jgi:hypothetical protein